MSDGPATIPPRPRGANLSVREVMEAVVGYLQRHGVETGRYDLDRLVGGVEVDLYDVIQDGAAWDRGRHLFFCLTHVPLRGFDSRVGRGAFGVTIKRTRTMAEAAQDIPVTTVFDLWAVPNADRSITFHRIIKREGGRVFYQP